MGSAVLIFSAWRPQVKFKSSVTFFAAVRLWRTSQSKQMQIPLLSVCWAGTKVRRLLRSSARDDAAWSSGFMIRLPQRSEGMGQPGCRKGPSQALHTSGCGKLLRACKHEHRSSKAPPNLARCPCRDSSCLHEACHTRSQCAAIHH